MLFVSYWELNENMPEQQRLEAAQRIASMESSDNVEPIRWDITSDNWGVSIFEAKEASDVIGMFDTWRASAPGFFKLTKTAPAMTAEESMALGAEIQKALGG